MAILVVCFIFCLGVQFIYVSQSYRLENEQVTSKWQRMIIMLIKNSNKMSRFISYVGPILCLILLGYFIYEMAINIEKSLLSAIPQTVKNLIILVVILCLSSLFGYIYYGLHKKWLPRWLQANDHVFEDELKILMKEFELGDQAQQSRAALVDNVFEFSETMAREIMTPRIDMYCLDINRSFQWNVEYAVTQMRTRYPVVNEGKDDIVGFIHIKDLLVKSNHTDANKSWQQWIRPILAISETMAIHELLSMMQKQKTQIALLIDEYGGTSGMVTLEDILEELVGDIQDEFDKEVHEIVKLHDREYSLSAMLLIEEVNSYFNIRIEVNEFDSIGGYMYAGIQFPPRLGQCVAYRDGNRLYEFIIAEMEQLRITRIKLKLSIVEEKERQTQYE